MTTTEKNGCAGRVHKTCRYNSTDGSKQDEIEANELLQELLKGPVKKKTHEKTILLLNLLVLNEYKCYFKSQVIILQVISMTVMQCTFLHNINHISSCSAEWTPVLCEQNVISNLSHSIEGILYPLCCFFLSNMFINNSILCQQIFYCRGFLFTLNFSFKYIVDLETLLTD